MTTRIIFGLLSVATLWSCCYTGLRSSDGLPRARMKAFATYSYDGIDTTAIYRTDEYIHRDLRTGRDISRERVRDNPYPYASYLKFYPKGKLGLFIIPKDEIDSLRHDHFDPAKAKMGYFGQEGERLVTRISTLGNCTLHISKSKGRIWGDTIVLFQNDGHGKTYVRQRVDPGLLQGWSPDW